MPRTPGCEVIQPAGLAKRLMLSRLWKESAQPALSYFLLLARADARNRSRMVVLIFSPLVSTFFVILSNAKDLARSSARSTVAPILCIA